MKRGRKTIEKKLWVDVAKCVLFRGENEPNIGQVVNVGSSVPPQTLDFWHQYLKSACASSGCLSPLGGVERRIQNF